MTAHGKINFALIALLCIPATANAQRARFETRNDPAGWRWIKGNTHSHTLESDGDSPPEVVASWYKRHGYNFLVLSDHNVLVDPARLAHLVDSTFLLIPGEEVSAVFQKKAVHINGLNIHEVIQPQSDSTLLGTVQKNVDAVRAIKGVPHINHPNFQWALSSQILAHVRNDKLFEIYNGHPLVNNLGGGDSPGMEEVWDRLLSGGKRIYGIAVDDAHHFLEEFSAERANPGRGWVVVRANQLEAHAILTSMEAGNFYASSGVELNDIVLTRTTMTVRIREKGMYKYTTEFIGQGGRILKRTGSNPATYKLTGTEKYVRAKVTSSGGAAAWVQPTFVTRR